MFCYALTVCINISHGHMHVLYMKQLSRHSSISFIDSTQVDTTQTNEQTNKQINKQENKQTSKKTSKKKTKQA